MTISIRSLRGGSWYDLPWNARASLRLRYEPSDRYVRSGFRWALVVWRRQ